MSTKTCLCCLRASAPEASTCPCCGEASWSPIAAPPIEAPTEPPVEPEEHDGDADEVDQADDTDPPGDTDPPDDAPAHPTPQQARRKRGRRS